ncbi:HAD family phosphatase [Streptomyces carpaticus]|uniref:HAD family hydrolase n=1 Tax=Streptomyces carpaticus TaxID=285558 RepID=UPI002204ED76|nr:HAD family phosphatase [Streptomyces carpaticus]
MSVDLTTYEAVIADWDGTCVDSQPLNYRSLAAALLPYGVSLRRDWYVQRIGTSGAELLAELGVTADPGVVLEDCGRRIIRELPSLKTFPTVVGWVTAARQAGRPCAVASGGGGAVVRAGLAATRLDALFDHVVTREAVPRGKPAPDLFLEAARRLGVPPERCVVIEDADEGLEAARAAGMQVVDVRPWVVPAW